MTHRHRNLFLVVLLSLMAGFGIGSGLMHDWPRSAAPKAAIARPSTGLTAKPVSMEAWLQSLEVLHDDRADTMEGSRFDWRLRLLAMASHPARQEALVAGLNQPEDSSNLSRIVAHLFRQLASKDPHEALTLAHRLTTHEAGAVQAVFETWAKDDPKEALDFILSRPDIRLYRHRAVTGVMAEMTRQDPMAAVARVVELTDYLEGANYDSYRAIALAWSERDAAGLQDWLGDAGDHPLRKDANFLGAILSSLQSRKAHDEALTYALKFDDELTDGFLLAKAVSGAAFQSAGPGIMSLEVEAPLKALARIPQERLTPSLAANLGRDVGNLAGMPHLTEPLSEALPKGSAEAFWNGLVTAVVPRDANLASRLTQRLEDSDNRVAAYQSIAKAWSQQDYEAAAEWLAEFPPTPEREAARAVFVDTLTKANPGASVGWD